MTPTRTRYLVLAGLCGAAALAYFTRNGIVTAESTIRGDLGLSKEQSGVLLSAFFWPYALFQVPAAMLAQKIGARWALALYGFLWSIATAGFATGKLEWMIASRAFMGIAQAGLVPVGVSAISVWFSRGTQASASGAFSGCMSVGSIVAAPLSAWLVTACGWRQMFVWYALPGILWALWFAYFYRNRPAEHPSANEAERRLIAESLPGSSAPECGTKTSVPLRTLLANPSLWHLCVQQFCRAAGYIFFASWFATYLQEARGVTLMRSGWLTTLPLLADVTGCMFGGVLSDAVLRRTGNARLARQGVSAMALLLCAGLIFGAWFVAQPVLAVIVISGGMFCAAIANPCLAATSIAMGGPRVGTVSAITNMVGNFGAASFPLAVPWLIGHAGGWNAVIVAFILLYIIAAAFWLLVRTDDRLS